jgi:tetratricopeptide (TPR) repeat protein
MTQRRYLFGPVDPDYVENYLAGPRARRECLTFHPSAPADLPVRFNDTWSTFAARFPADWQPDFVFLYLPYSNVPAFLWSAPLPLIAIAPDANLLWHLYRHWLPRCDLVLTDTTTAERLTAIGVEQTLVVNLFGLSSVWLQEQAPQSERDIDILFCGNLHPDIQRDRLCWLGRLGRLSGHLKVSIATGFYKQDYRNLVRRSRIVFNRSIRGEANQRTFEAVAAGALLFQEEGNREVPQLLRDCEECVYYRDDNFEELLEFYLTHEDELRRIADAAHARVQSFTFDSFWNDALVRIDAVWPQVVERCRSRCSAPAQRSSVEVLRERTWEAISSAEAGDKGLAPDIVEFISPGHPDAALNNACGLALIRHLVHEIGDPEFRAAVEHFRQAVRDDPSHILARLNLVESLLANQRGDEALSEARAALIAAHQWLFRDLRQCPWLDDGHYPPVFDTFRVEWEWAGFNHAGNAAAEADAKFRLILWRLHALIAHLTGELVHAYEAALLRPDLPATRALLGVFLARAGRLREAAGHLRAARDVNPFDRQAALVLYQVLNDLGDEAGSSQLVAERRRLAEVAPKVVPLEEWMV